MIASPKLSGASAQNLDAPFEATGYNAASDAWVEFQHRLFDFEKRHSQQRAEIFEVCGCLSNAAFGIEILETMRPLVFTMQRVGAVITEFL